MAVPRKIGSFPRRRSRLQNLVGTCQTKDKPSDRVEAKGCAVALRGP